MNCRYSEHDIALFVEGDLKDPASREVEAHLNVCGACRGLAADLRESQSMFKALRQETVSGAALGQVRNLVLAEVAGARSTTSWGRRVERWLYQGARRGYALAGVGLTILLFAGLWYARKPAPEAPRVVQNAPLPPAAAVPLAEKDKVAAPSSPNVPIKTVSSKDGDGRRRRPGARTVSPKPAAPAPAPQEAPRQLVVKLLTDDPNIVIYWLVDQNGG